MAVFQVDGILNGAAFDLPNRRIALSGSRITAIREACDWTLSREEIAALRCQQFREAWNEEEDE